MNSVNYHKSGRIEKNKAVKLRKINLVWFLGEFRKPTVVFWD